MQEYDVFVGKFRSAQNPSPPDPAPPQWNGQSVLQDAKPSKKRPWLMWAPRLVVRIFKTQDLDIETYRQLEEKRTRQQIEQDIERLSESLTAGLPAR